MMEFGGFIVTRELSPEEADEFRAKVAAVGVTPTLPAPDGTPASAPASDAVPLPVAPTAGNLAQGKVPFNDVVGQWVDGVPVAFIATDRTAWTNVPREAWDAIVRHFGSDQWMPMAYIAYLESAFVAAAHNSVPPDDSYGLLQVNRLAWPQYTPEELETYDGNAAAARTIYDAQGYGAWYNSSKRLGLI